MDIDYLDRKVVGWERAWRAVEAKWGPLDAGEGWQYMGSANGTHQFRNRMLHGERRYENVPIESGDFHLAPVAALPKFGASCNG